MATSYEFDLHYLARKAKSRLTGHRDSSKVEFNKHERKAKETYALILEIATSKETVYNPIARYIGKDLKKVPDSTEKIRAVLQTSNYVEKIKARVRSDLIQKAKNNEPVIVNGKEYDPLAILCKLH